jgi:hypothetical protein
MKPQLPNNLSRLWSNYKTILRTSFNNMTPSDRDDLLTKASVICTIGVTILALGLFYSLIPRELRVSWYQHLCLPPGGWAAKWWQKRSSTAFDTKQARLPTRLLT